jgi:hypothetical protein
VFQASSVTKGRGIYFSRLLLAAQFAALAGQEPRRSSQ